MNDIFKLLHFVKPYWRRAVAALLLLTSLVFMDLSIPRLVQRIIDQGINQHNQAVVIQTSLIMLGISLVSTMIAIGNNITSVQVAESVGRDLRDAIFSKIQSFSYGNLDRLKTGQLIVRMTSDSGAVQRVFQISLRIGTRAAPLDDRQLDPDVQHQPPAGTIPDPLIIGHINCYRVLCQQDGTALSECPAKTRPSK